MKDSYGREIGYLRISVTDRCDLRCKYCMPAEGLAQKLAHEATLTFEEIEAVAREAIDLGISKIRLTGGEPFARKDLMILIRKLAALPGLEELAITTNGILIQPHLRELYDLGVKRLNISLDTFDPQLYEEITGVDGLERVLETIRQAKAIGFKPIKINAVLLKGISEKELDKFVIFSEEEGVEIRFIELMPFGGLPFGPAYFLSSDWVIKALDLHKAPDQPKGPATMYLTPKGGRIGLIDPLTCSFCKECNRIRLTADGKLRPCLHDQYELDLKAHLRAGKAPKVLLEEAIHHKPKEHKLHEQRTIRNMNTIGG